MSHIWTNYCKINHRDPWRKGVKNRMIIYDKKQHIFQLNTKSTSYMIGITPEGYLGHIYYGERLQHIDGGYLLRMEEYPYTPERNKREKCVFLESFPMELPTGGIGDFRESCLDIRDEHGCLGTEILYKEHRIYSGKTPLEGLPASFVTASQMDTEDAGTAVQTLELICQDRVLGVEVVLSYTAFEREDVITRSVRVHNRGEQTLTIEKIYSACLDMDYEEDYELLTLPGAWARERRIQRRRIGYGRQSAASIRGESGHQEHPFIALVTPGTTQTQGDVYAMHFVYSGNFLGQVEVSQHDMIRMTMGIHSYEFGWKLTPGQSFQAPEVVFTYSSEGLGKMTRSLHDFYREHLIRSRYKNTERPILINNWEATYFDFTTEKLLDIAQTAKDCGIELFVMDDGWFGRRNNDESSLGDWYVNESKLTGGLKYLVDSINKIGLKFGIWFEPEMISPDSDLFRAHPDWMIQIPGREPTLSRAQGVLDLSNPEVEEYAYESVARILRSAPIMYVKWDMNRQLSDLGSAYLDKEHGRELLHRYVLAVYRMQERLITEFPDLLLENCSGGGGRFDPGMLYYSPQIWCSDDTDAVERLGIQEGTALIYPLSTIGAHVSACPNHTVGRNTPFVTRGHVALAGTFGYELDVTKLSEEEKALIREQTEMYHTYQLLIRNGDYYRLASYAENHYYDAYMVVSKDQKEALMTFVQVLAEPNRRSRKVHLQGLDPEAVYYCDVTQREYTGEILMKGGLLIGDLWGDAVSRLYHFEKR